VAAASYLLQYSEIGDIFIKYMRNRRWNMDLQPSR
jgi:hypothetical protein